MKTFLPVLSPRDQAPKGRRLFVHCAVDLSTATCPLRPYKVNLETWAQRIFEDLQDPAFFRKPQASKELEARLKEAHHLLSCMGRSTGKVLKS